jgi:hypothetical protein
MKPKPPDFENAGCWQPRWTGHENECSKCSDVITLKNMDELEDGTIAHWSYCSSCGELHAEFLDGLPDEQSDNEVNSGC